MTGWILVLAALFAQYPYARWFLRGDDDDPILTLALTFALSAGVVSLIGLWIGLIRLPIGHETVSVIALTTGLIGFVVLHPPPLRFRLPRTRADRAVCALIGVTAGLVLFNATYWPPHLDDAVAIYGYQGKQIALTGRLPVPAPDIQYEGYPMAVPLLYAFVHRASGAVNEPLAALIPALMSVGVIGVAYSLGRVLYSPHVGVVAALLTALSPMFAHWASSGYVDLPTGFFYGLSAVFAARWEKSGRWQDALLIGIMAGMAAWVKNSSLLILPGIGLWMLMRLINGPNRGAVLRGAVLIGVGWAGVAGVWYARNLILAGYIVPPTGWTWLAQRTVINLFPHLADPRYGLPGVVMAAGTLIAAWRALRREAAARLLWTLYGPFFVAWWALVSYDGRFMLAVLPLAAVMGAAALPIPASAGRPARALIVGVVALAAGVTWWAAVDYKEALIRRPLAGIEERTATVLGDRYGVVVFLRGLPPGSRIWTTDTLLPYRADGLHVTAGGLPTTTDAYDYLILQPGQAPPPGLPLREVYAGAGWRVMARP